MNSILHKLTKGINLLIFGILFFVIFMCILYWTIDVLPEWGSFDSWDKFLSPLLAIFTAFMGLIIFIKQRLNTWVDQLPKLYTSHTFCKGKLIISCYNFQTTSKHDIRQPLQSFLKNKCNNNINLDLDAGNQITNSDLEKIDNVWYKRYLFVNSLRSIPSSIKEGEYAYFEGGLLNKDFLQESPIKIHKGQNPNEHILNKAGKIEPNKLPFLYEQMLNKIENSLKEKSK